jgi:ferritin-like metal-binding protein YciE
MNGTTTKPAQNGKESITSNTKQNTVKSSAPKSKSGVAHGLRSLFVDELKDIYFAEKALIKAIPKMIQNATAMELTHALTGHLEETKKQVTRLEKVFSLIGEKAEGKKCEAITGLIKEAEEIMGATEKGMVRDAGIILAGQKVEHYEIATYGTLRIFARTLGEDAAADLLDETLGEEKSADQKLTEIALAFVNDEAAQMA